MSSLRFEVRISQHMATKRRTGVASRRRAWSSKVKFAVFFGTGHGSSSSNNIIGVANIGAAVLSKSLLVAVHPQPYLIPIIITLNHP
ncbi:hypothetical protein PAXINDRAFT_16177 [Paxillus involutus ATCC 200175]|uniref:Uncharacterized protein n=1 Tax=Paxillus involutus ATCC 200175 TaxID=664439 RepID=A0A0C9T5B0_PAXIN|nr:hypothetical protein PAXINDRAFT_16177 [Paxillus involutus ATCC 200175]